MTSLPTTRLVFTRRSLAEQRLIRMMRICAEGRSVDPEDSKHYRLPKSTLKRLARFTSIAVAKGYRIHPPGALYASRDELRLVGLFAQAQRLRFTNRIRIEPELHDLLVGIAAALEADGIRLPPISLVAADQAALHAEGVDKRE